jgi:hypothetical protein
MLGVIKLKPDVGTSSLGAGAAAVPPMKENEETSRSADAGMDMKPKADAEAVVPLLASFSSLLLRSNPPNML